MLAILKESGSVPGDANGIKSSTDSAKKKKRPDKGVSTWRASLQLMDDTNKSVKIDMEKLAENLQKMGEDDLLVVVQMIHDNKSSRVVDQKRRGT